MSVTVQPAYHRYQFRVLAGQHELIADLARDVQGDDTGPDPHQLIEAALAVCTAQTVTMYAQRKAWPLREIHVRVGVESREGSSHFLREIDLIGELAEEQRQRLLDIANKCPIHRILTGPIVVQSELKRLDA